jgi:hypothetical protein
MEHTTNIDTLKLQIDFRFSSEQREVMNNISKCLITTYSFLNVTYDTSTNVVLIHRVHTAGTKILELVSGSYQNIYKNTIYFIAIEFAGLKRYNKFDKIAMDCLIRVVAYLNTNNIIFNFTGIDIAVDIHIPFINTYSFCNKKAPHVTYYTTYEKQPYASTQYIEKFLLTHHRVMKRAYLYDKNIKEEDLCYNITRFELKLQSNFFNKHSFMVGVLEKELDRYHILCFPTLQEKAIELSMYAQYENTIRRRDLHKLGLDRYRVIPDTKEIEYFLFSLYDIYESDLNLAITSEDDGFDFNFFF